MASKSSQPARYRKGSELQVGDQVAVRWQGARPSEFSPVVSVELVNPSTVGQSGAKQYRAVLANGTTKTTTASGYVEGQYA
jgi:hypothetical protein